MNGDEYRKLISGRIREQRERIGLTKADLAKALKVDNSLITVWEKSTLPRLTRFPEVASVLRTTVDKLLHYPEEVAS